MERTLRKVRLECFEGDITDQPEFDAVVTPPTPNCGVDQPGDQLLADCYRRVMV